MSAIPYGRQAIDDDDIEAVVTALRSAWLTTGPTVGRFEERLQDTTGCPHAVAVSNGTAALHCAVAAFDVGPGDEVITSPLTFASTANVVVHCGATPVFADVEPDTFNLSAERFAAAITPRTKAVIPVHLFGQSCDMDAISAIARKHGIAVIEDAAHEIGRASCRERV